MALTGSLLLLPGMDGTGRLFAPLLRHLDCAWQPRVISFPPDRPCGYAALLEEIDVPDGPFAIVAESFSGPVGVKLANRHAHRCRALVLVATFVRNPSALAASMAALIGPRMFRLRPPDHVLRWALLGSDSSAGEVQALRSAIESVAPEVLASRVREILSVDATEDFAKSSVPSVYVAGSRDRLVGQRTLAEMKQLRPDMKTYVLDAPHLVLQRRPAESAAIISTIE